MSICYLKWFDDMRETAKVFTANQSKKFSDAIQLYKRKQYTEAIKVIKAIQSNDALTPKADKMFSDLMQKCRIARKELKETYRVRTQRDQNERKKKQPNKKTGLLKLAALVKKHNRETIAIKSNLKKVGLLRIDEFFDDFYSVIVGLVPEKERITLLKTGGLEHLIEIGGKRFFAFLLRGIEECYQMIFAYLAKVQEKNNKIANGIISSVFETDKNLRLMLSDTGWGTDTEDKARSLFIYIINVNALIQSHRKNFKGEEKAVFKEISDFIKETITRQIPGIIFAKWEESVKLAIKTNKFNLILRESDNEIRRLFKQATTLFHEKEKIADKLKQNMTLATPTVLRWLLTCHFFLVDLGDEIKDIYSVSHKETMAVFRQSNYLALMLLHNLKQSIIEVESPIEKAKAPTRLLAQPIVGENVKREVAKVKVKTRGTLFAQDAKPTSIDPPHVSDGETKHREFNHHEAELTNLACTTMRVITLIRQLMNKQTARFDLGDITRILNSLGGKVSRNNHVISISMPVLFSKKENDNVVCRFHKKARNSVGEASLTDIRKLLINANLTEEIINKIEKIQAVLKQDMQKEGFFSPSSQQTVSSAEFKGNSTLAYTIPSAVKF